MLDESSDCFDSTFFYYQLQQKEIYFQVDYWDINNSSQLYIYINNFFVCLNNIA